MRLDEIIERIHEFAEDAICICEAEPVDRPGPRIIFVNRAFEHQSGYRFEDVVGKTPRILQGPDTCKDTIRRIGQNLRAWQPVREEILNYRKDGSSFWSELAIQPVADDTGWYHYWVSIQRDISRRKQAESDLIRERDMYQKAAFVDDLTGLLNRRGLTARAERLAGEMTSKSGVAYFQMDLDRFKVINDTMGHEAGDIVLRAISQRLAKCLRPGDHAARVGGDEFVILRPGSCGSQLQEQAQEICEAIAGPLLIENQYARCATSVGVAHGDAQDLLTGRLARRSDLALYKAKGAGRNQARQFEPEMERQFLDEVALGRSLEAAIDENTLHVVYMPKVCATTGDLLGIEALARWIHPEHGAIPPGQFLPIARDLNLIEEIDAFVMARARDHQTALREAGERVPPISVNVSERRLRSPRLLQDIDRLGLTGTDVSIELLETIFLERMSPEEEVVLEALRERGIPLEIDDFGSGHASILSLTQVRPSWLKIDGALARGVENDRNAEQVIRSIVSIAHTMGVSVVAEGVETFAQADALRRLGCHALQGFLFGRPGTLEEAIGTDAKSLLRIGSPAPAPSGRGGRILGSSVLGYPSP